MPNLGFVNAELIVQEGGLAPLVELLSSSNEVSRVWGAWVRWGGSGWVFQCTLWAFELMQSTPPYADMLLGGLWRKTSLGEALITA